MQGLDDLVGTSFGPFRVEVTKPAVDEFAAAIGDDQAAASGRIPQMYANRALFSAAPAFLHSDRVAPFTRSLIHSDQTYDWARPLEIGEVLEVTGTVESVRVRGSLNLVTFAVDAGSAVGHWMRSSSVFLMSTDAAADTPDEPEPEAEARPPVDGSVGRLTIPEPGEAIAPMACGASRADLVRYAAASADSNPIHLDHAAARSAGLGGIIVHGLLMGAWMARAVERYGTLSALRLRFRSPLRPSAPARVTGVVAGRSGLGADVDLVLESDEQRLVTGRASVTP